MNIRQRQYVPQSRKKETTLLILGVLLFLGILLFPPTRNFIFSVGRGIGLNLGKGTKGAGERVSIFFGNFKSKRAVEKENDDLKMTIEELNLRIAERDLLAKENSELKETLGRAGTTHFTLARILAKPPQSVYDSLIIDGGSSANIQKDQMVYAYGQVLVGTIDEVFNNSAKVRVFSTPGEKFMARLEPSHIDVSVVGRGGGNYSAEVPHSIVLNRDSYIVTTELNQHIIGKFEKVISDERDPFQVGLFVSPVNIMSLSFVAVAESNR